LPRNLTDTLMLYLLSLNGLRSVPTVAGYRVTI